MLGVLPLVLVGCGAFGGQDGSKVHRSELKNEAVRGLLRTVIGYELDRLPASEEQSSTWELCALYSGIIEAFDATGNSFYSDRATHWAQANEWEIQDDHFRNADYQCVGQVYLDLYRHDGDAYKIQDTRATFDRILEDPRPGDKAWNWADALFMAPPVLARLGHVTGKDVYFDFLSEQFWEASEPLFDPEYGLYYRDERFIDQESESGEKVFWSRGNGWVLAGLARILQFLPTEHPVHDRFADRFRTMAAAVAPLQGKDGRWRPSLLDSDEYPMPETSGTAFFTYALAWGINAGYLSSEKYRPVVEKGWKGLVDAVNDDGRLGWVQSVSAEPGPVERHETGAYGVGGFLMAGSEVLHLIDDQQ